MPRTYFFGDAFSPLTLSHEYAIRMLLATDVNRVVADDAVIQLAVIKYDGSPYEWTALDRLTILNEWLTANIPKDIRDKYLRPPVIQDKETWDFLKDSDVDVLVISDKAKQSLLAGEWKDSDKILEAFELIVIKNAFCVPTGLVGDTTAMPELLNCMSKWAIEAYRMPTLPVTKVANKHMEPVYRGCVDWIKEFMQKTGFKKIVLGISGGKDSSICAALCAEAVGAENVIGVEMPNDGYIRDYYADLLFEYTGIRHIVVPITDAYNSVCAGVNAIDSCEISQRAKVNLAPRLRMTTLYAVAQSVKDGALVCCTDNWSERSLGYSTLWGDNVGDFAPLLNMPVSMVLALGDYMCMPYGLVHRTPSDGLTGKTDEEAFGFTYEDLENWERDNTSYAQLTKPGYDYNAIQQRVTAAKFKRDIVNIPAYEWRWRKTDDE